MRALLVITVLGLSALLLGSAAAAGGWAVTTLDRLPDRFEAGTTYDIGFTIRQHGVTPVDLSDVAIVAVKADSGKRLRFPASRDGAVGHYLARVTFPADGAWTWLVEQGWFAPQDLGTLKVAMPGAALAPTGGTAAAAAIAPAAAPPTPTRGHDGLLIGGLLIALAGGAVLFGDRVARAVTPAHA